MEGRKEKYRLGEKGRGEIYGKGSAGKRRGEASVKKGRGERDWDGREEEDIRKGSTKELDEEEKEKEKLT